VVTANKRNPTARNTLDPLVPMLELVLSSSKLKFSCLSSGVCRVFFNEVGVSDQSCKGNVVLTMGYPGRSNLGAVGKKIVAFSCK